MPICFALNNIITQTVRLLHSLLENFETERGPERPCCTHKYLFVDMNLSGSTPRTLLVLYLCYVFRALINSLVRWSLLEPVLLLECKLFAAYRPRNLPPSISIYLSIYLSICLSISPSLPLSLSVCLSLRPDITGMVDWV